MSTRFVAAITCCVSEPGRGKKTREKEQAHFDIVARGEAIHLAEQLEHRALHLAVSGLVAVEALGVRGPHSTLSLHTGLQQKT